MRKRKYVFFFFHLFCLKRFNYGDDYVHLLWGFKLGITFYFVAHPLVLNSHSLLRVSLVNITVRLMSIYLETPSFLECLLCGIFHVVKTMLISLQFFFSTVTRFSIIHWLIGDQILRSISTHFSFFVHYPHEYLFLIFSLERNLY